MNTILSFATAFALTMFAAKAQAAALGPKHTGGAIFVTKKRHRHGRTYRA
jgi:hypothetical protein